MLLCLKHICRLWCHLPEYAYWLHRNHSQPEIKWFTPSFRGHYSRLSTSFPARWSIQAFHRTCNSEWVSELGMERSKSFGPMKYEQKGTGLLSPLLVVNKEGFCPYCCGQPSIWEPWLDLGLGQSPHLWCAEQRNRKRSGPLKTWWLHSINSPEVSDRPLDFQGCVLVKLSVLFNTNLI